MAREPCRSLPPGRVFLKAPHQLPDLLQVRGGETAVDDQRAWIEVRLGTTRGSLPIDVATVVLDRARWARASPRAMRTAALPPESVAARW
jgi:hypothetical protein